VNEQETRREYFLPQIQETAQECSSPQGQKIIQEFLFRKAAKALQFQPADFAAATDRAAVNQEAGDFPSRSSLLVFLAAKEFIALNGGNHTDGAFFARLGALHAAEATDAYWSG
jgi:hypothetical protein